MQAEEFSQLYLYVFLAAIKGCLALGVLAGGFLGHLSCCAASLASVAFFVARAIKRL